MRGPDGGPLVPIKIEPADFHTTAQRFVDASNTLYQVLPSLFRVLGGFAARLVSTTGPSGLTPRTTRPCRHSSTASTGQ